jgi:hypothetical protein
MTGLVKAVVFVDFDDEQSALDYVIKSQKDRRNWTPARIMSCVATLDRVVSKGGDRGNQHTGGKVPKASGDAFGKSSEVTAEKLGVSARTVDRVRSINKPDTPVEIKEPTPK